MRALGLYSILSILLTWPLILGLGRDVPGDLGDSLLNMWILAWGAEHLPKLLTFQISWSDFWNGNIFAPEPLTLALSEHLFGQVLQILPIYWLTGNIILCYQLLFISTFALSAFGTYLLVRDLTGDWRAAFVAGLIYGFLPYRVGAFPHLQVMSSQWMPFALWGLNRFIAPVPGARLPAWGALALGTGAIVMQNWSCGYYLLYFAPFVLLFVGFRMWTAGELRNFRMWAQLAIAGTVTFALTIPFLLPYLEASRQFAIERPIGEVVWFSANVWSYATASESLWLWGDIMRAYPRAEGETFLGIVPWLLALAVLVPLFRSVAFGGALEGNAPRWLRITFWLLLVIATAQLVALISVVLFGGFNVGVGGLRIRASTPMRLLFQFITAAGLLLAVSPRLRARLALASKTQAAFFFVLTMLAIWLSLGPIPRAGESASSGIGLYAGLYHYEPGFNGLRVPARYAMLAGLFLSVLAGFGTVAVLRAKVLRVVPVALCVALLSAAVLAESVGVPIEINRNWGGNEVMPPSRVLPRAEAPPVYGRIAALPQGSVITELPFGDGAWEMRYVYYATTHWKPITNGYSGAFPPGYMARVARLQRITTDPEPAWQSLRDSGTTHVVLHRSAFARTEVADLVESWLRAHGANEMARYPDGDILFSLTPNS